MRSKFLFAMPLSLTPLVTLALVLPSGGQTGRPKTPSSFAQTTETFFAQSCNACHNAKAKSGGLDLTALPGPDSVARHRETWESVLRKVRTGEMPPPGSPKPTQAAIQSVTTKVEAEFEQADKRDAGNPGRVTARRLNRAEYNNTVRDLLGIDTHPADDFPQDDSGYGFDNIGDALSLSSSRMEQYVTAAEKIARTAVYGAEPLQPTLVVLSPRARPIPATNTVPAHYDVSGFTLPNSLHATHRFPVEAEYLFRIKLDGLRPLGSDAIHIGLWIDGKKRQTFDFDPTGQAAFSTDKQDFSSRTVECRLRVPGGDHWIAAVIERMYEGLPEPYNGPSPAHRVVPPLVIKPRPGLTPERIKQLQDQAEERRKERSQVNDVHINSVQIGGPYAQPTGPSEESLKKIFTCGHLHGGHTAACARKIVTDLGGRAFRRPLTPQEVTRYLQLVSQVRSQGDSFEESLCLAIQGMLVSPHFLYRIEHDPAPTATKILASNPPSQDAAGHLINPYELATRLSYFLWSSMPDETLRQCAVQGTLRQPAVLKAQIQRMLQDPKANTLAENFAGQWLQIRSLESVKPDRGLFPAFDDYLRMSMRQETELFFENMVHEDRSIVDLLTGKYSFMNERLAEFYGISGVEGPEFRKVDLSSTPRGGILTQASVLTVTSYPNRTSPVLRGKWILENILNAPPPAPPPGVPALDVSTVGKDASLRQQLEAHRKNPTCASCHARMDPLGFGLENFNAIGRFRERDGKFAIDSSGTLPDGRSFQGPDGLKDILKADRDAFAQCLTSKLLTYALGRGLEGYDRPTVKQITQHVAAHDYRFSDLVLEIVTSRPFQMRRGDRTL